MEDLANAIDGINYYNQNVLRNITNWDLLSNAEAVKDEMLIRPGGSAGILLSNDYYSGLNSSKYRRVVVKINMEYNSSYEYNNLVEVLIRALYKDSQGKKYIAVYSLPVNTVQGRYSGGDVSFDRVVEMEDWEMENCAVYVINHSQYNVYLMTAEMYRSQDISGSQVGGSIGWSVTLSKVVAYLDGCELYFDGNQTPDKLWWQEDEQGNFSGINVNNERLISFSRKNEILLD